MKVLMGQVQQVERTMEEVRANRSKVSHLRSLHTAGMTCHTVVSQCTIDEVGNPLGSPPQAKRDLHHAVEKMYSQLDDQAKVKLSQLGGRLWWWCMLRCCARFIARILL